MTAIIPTGANVKKWNDAWDSLYRFECLNEREPLSPIWEIYINGIWKPAQRGYLLDFEAGNAPDVGESRRNLYQAGLTLAPFDMSNEAVNIERAYQFCETLAAITPIRRWFGSKEDVVKVLLEEQRTKKDARNRRKHILAAARIIWRYYASLSRDDPDSWSSRATAGGTGRSGKGKRKRAH